MGRSTRPGHGFRRRSLSRLLAAAVTMTAVALQPAAVAGATTGAPHAGPLASAGQPKQHATFGIGPARAGRLDPSRPYFNLVTTPGVHVRDQVIITNYSKIPLTLAVYATDAVNATNGDFSLLGQGVRPTDAGAWITVGTPAGSGNVTVAPRSHTVLPVRITVPADAAPGDHGAGVIASLSTVGKNAKGANVRLLQRVGARFFIRVSGRLRPQLSVERLRAHYVQNWNPVGTGHAIVTYRVHNTGNVKMGARQLVSVRGLFGSTARVTPASVPLLLPGGHVDVRVSVPGVFPEIWMKASVRLTPIVLTGDSDTGLRTSTASTHFWAIPWILLAILGSLAVIGWGAWRRRRRRNAAPPGPPVAGRADPQLVGPQGG